MPSTDTFSHTHTRYPTTNIPYTSNLIPYNSYTLYIPVPEFEPKNSSPAADKEANRKRDRESQRETSLGLRAMVNLPRAGEISRSTR